MQIIVVLIIILVICFILNVNLGYILMATDVLLCMFAGLMCIGFLYCVVRLMLSKRKTARFVRTDMHKHIKKKVAIYLIEGTEYPCAFPAENILDNKLYSTEKSCRVMLDIKKKKVYDLYAVLTCTIGLTFFIGLCIVLWLYH